MWADNETTTDLLNVRHLVRVISDTIQTDRLLPLTIGIYGGWGSGKSSLVHMVRADLEQQEGIVCISFNGWLFESYEDAKSALMGTILDEIRTRRKLGAEARSLLGKLSARVDWFRVMSLAGKGALTLALGGLPGALAGVEMGPAGMKALARKAGEKAVAADPEKLKEFVQEEEAEEPVHAIRAFREDFVKLLEETKIKTLVVFIDELDRCIPETVVQTLEAIRLFLFAERTAFVIGADERLVQHAVRQRFKLEGMDPQIGADYLEKMIQIPFRIPPLGRREIHTYMNLLFAELHCEKEPFCTLVDTLGEREGDAYGELSFSFEDAREMLDPLPPELSESFALAEQLAETLTQGMAGNPRQTKRFLNTLLLRMRLGGLRKIELRPQVLGKLMLLEYFRPEHFRILAGWQGRQAGVPEEIAVLEQALREGTAADTAKVAKVGAAAPVAPTKPVRGKAAPLRGVVADEEAPAAAPARVPDHAREWLDDGWLRSWLGLKPELSEVNLGPYFYIVHDKIGHTDGSLLQLSPGATEVLRQLRSPSEAVRTAGHGRLKELSPGEAAGVLQEIGTQARQAERLAGANEPPLISLFLVAEARPELATEVIAILRAIPESQLPMGVIPRLMLSVKDTPAEPQARELIGQWSRSTVNERLARAAQTQSK
jgi:hypothetical protein